MKPYGHKKCLVAPCVCCTPLSKALKVTNNKSRARREGKKEIENGNREHRQGQAERLQRNVGGRKKAIR
jgi:hypothetical protein